MTVNRVHFREKIQRVSEGQCPEQHTVVRNVSETVLYGKGKQPHFPSMCPSNTPITLQLKLIHSANKVHE